MRLLIARHGETEWNIQGRVQGRGDSPLTPKGIAQAQALAEAWRDEGIEEIVSSTQGRARHTARILAEGLGGLPCRADAALVEQHFGDYEGRLIAELRASGARIDDILHGLQPDFRAPGGGESLREAGGRLRRAIEAMAAARHARTVGLVTHGSTLRSMLWLLAGEEGDSNRFRHGNASFSEIVVEDGAPHIVRWGVATHLLPAVEL